LPGAGQQGKSDARFHLPEKNDGSKLLLQLLPSSGTGLHILLSEAIYIISGNRQEQLLHTIDGKAYLILQPEQFSGQ
jgi:hypothetical protein